MKKHVMRMLTVCLCLVTAVVCFGCKPSEPDVEKIELSQPAITLESGETCELTYTTTPEGADVMGSPIRPNPAKYEWEDVFSFRVNDGKVKITALSTGTATLRIRAAADESVYAECTVTVKPPEGYTPYRGDDFKFVYPSTWEATEATGTLAAFKNENGTNINIAAEKKNPSYFSATADDFKKVLKQSWAAQGVTITGLTCNAGKYDSDQAVSVSYVYTIPGVGTCKQTQLIRHSSDKTYVLTVTYISEQLDEELSETIRKEFKAW
ncbi:MAG: hypothetical protein HFK10_07285 [Clostridia bacterium]|nr:hypothetical protein [Clostridia bacterium]